MYICQNQNRTYSSDQGRRKRHSYFSYNAYTTDCRFGKSSDFVKFVEDTTQNKSVVTIAEAEKFGPNKILDILIIAPCTGNTLAKLNNGITDTPVLMAAKGHLRTGRPLVISLSTNDALGMNFKNVGSLLNCKIYISFHSVRIIVLQNLIQ